MITFLISAVKIIFLLGFIILIHECGHFFMAKLCKVKVLDFAIGFGPTIWKKQGKETKYAIRAIPLGGYVNMIGEQERSDEEGSFSNASIPRRLLILLSGAVVNIVFGLLVYFILMSLTGNNISTVIQEIVPEYAAEQAGIQQGDQLLRIDGKKVRIKSDIDKLIAESQGNEVILTIKRDGEIKEIPLKPTKEEFKNIGIYLGAAGEDFSPEVKMVYMDTPAAELGIKQGDIIVSVDGIEIEKDAEKIVTAMSEAIEKTITVVIDRNGEILTFDAELQSRERYYLGVFFSQAEEGFINNIYYGFWETAEFSVSIIENLKELFTGKLGTDQLMGPVGISEVVTKTQGFREFIFMVALISLSLRSNKSFTIPAT